jgi:hypothetical protein
MIVDLYSINQQEDFNSNDPRIIAANKNIEIKLVPKLKKISRAAF